MVSRPHIRWFGLLALVGCSYRPSFQSPAEDDAPSTDGPSTDGALDAVVTNDTPLPTLVDRGLVLRYFMDEAATGQAPPNLIDSAPSPLALPITYGQATFFESNGNRGLHWPASLGDGKAEIAFSGTKLGTQLTPAQTVTIEVVAQISTAGSTAGSESQITGLRGGNPDFVLAAVGATDFRFFRPFGNLGATWVGANNQQRMVLHLVFDSTRADANERIELFRNGIAIAKSTSSPPGLGQNVGLGGSDDLMIGNRQAQDRSLGGTIFYVAYYNAALDAVEIANNAQRLIANDDL